MGSCLGKCLLKSENMLRQSRQNSEHEFVFLIDERSQNIPDKKRSFLSKLFTKRKSLKHPKKPVLELVDDLINSQLPLYSRLNESQRLPSTSTCCSHDIPMQCLDARVLLIKTRTSTPVSSIDLEWEHETLPISMVQDPSATSSWTAFPGDDLTTDPCVSIYCCNDEVTSSVTAYNYEGCMPNDDTDAVAAVAAHTNTADTDRSWSRISSENSLEWDNNVPTTINLLHIPITDCDDRNSRHIPVFTENQAEFISTPVELNETVTRTQLFEQVDLALDEADTLQLLNEIERLTKQTLEETGKDLDCGSMNS